MAAEKVDALSLIHPTAYPPYRLPGITLETSVDAAKSPFGLSLSKGERGFCGVTHGVRL
jgi:hypothetical protein